MQDGFGQPSFPGSRTGSGPQRYASPYPDRARSPSPSKRSSTGAQQQPQHPMPQQYQQQQSQQQSMFGRPGDPGPSPWGPQTQLPAPRRPVNASNPGQSVAQGQGPFGAEPFLGYNDLFLAGINPGPRPQAEDSEGDGRPTRAEDLAETLGRLDMQGSLRDVDVPGSAAQGPEGFPFPPPGMAMVSGMPNVPGLPASGSLSPRSLLHYHHQQLQAQHALALQAAQQAGGAHHSMAGGASMQEEITTVFIVGFPDDMTEREFANMFLFAKGFEASTLKIPAGGMTGTGQSGQRESSVSGPPGPYNSVQLQGMAPAGSNSGPSWDEQALSLALVRAGAGHDAFANLGAGAGLPGFNSNSQGQPGGKIKQIIGFAKFRTRQDALEARDALNGRKIDAERGCVLKTEMAKKNLHTRQRPALTLGIKPGPHGVDGGYGALSPYAGSAMGDRDPAHAFGYGSRPPPQPSQPGQGGFVGQPQGFDRQGALPQQETSMRHTELLRASGTGASNPSQSQAPVNFAQPQERWAPMGPLDFYNDEADRAAQPSARSDWGSVGSPPARHPQPRAPGLAPVNSMLPGAPYAAATGARMRQGEDFGVGELRQETHPDNNINNSTRPNQDLSNLLNDQAQASRPGPPGLGSPNVADPSSADQRPQAKNEASAPRSHRSGSTPSPPSSELPSPTHRGFVGDQHPPGTTLFVGNLPANLSSASSAQLEEKLRSLFSSRQGFRQMSYKLKGHGPMCFVEFESICHARNALTEVNGDSLGGLLKGQGIRLSYSKNPLFRHSNANSSPPDQGTGLNGFHSPQGPRGAMCEDVLDMDKLNNLEETAFGHGYAGGFTHGALHGKFEGRALGREKGFDIWGEVGYYEGMAAMWQRLLQDGTSEQDRSRKQNKQMQQIGSLLELIVAFPTRNDAAGGGSQDQSPDLGQLLERIRARFKLTASTLGFHPSDGPFAAGADLGPGTSQPQLAEIGGRLPAPKPESKTASNTSIAFMSTLRIHPPAEAAIGAAKPDAAFGVQSLLNLRPMHATTIISPFLLLHLDPHTITTSYSFHNLLNNKHRSRTRLSALESHTSLLY
ncbi:DUF1715-domain-containing protein [Tilletiaria anomala UBC 951]|uniref:DUF1715-domain-containing protein n=1 Tax=Tilletiaria anomala (strain ATCC 24038 / CBS 436.72 / UBC 951) TaxID=1037660 RepID=A0A066WK66_TILAU|nr:DUF1715-domain-containing protein [Tilletiaria anomala UBC 951]KDN52958.1 DUF1715-domain-containing protein [Tilletiaria anomala UBC 951]